MISAVLFFLCNSCATSDKRVSAYASIAVCESARDGCDSARMLDAVCRIERRVAVL